MSRFTRSLISTLGIAVALPFLGCVDPPDPINGCLGSSGNATVSGAISMNLVGCAYFTMPSVAPFGLAVQESNEASNIVFIFEQTGLIGTGTYDVGSLGQGAEVAVTFARSSPTPVRQFFGTSGTVTITSSSNSRVVGTFQLTALDTQNGTDQVTINGSFDAVTGQP